MFEAFGKSKLEKALQREQPRSNFFSNQFEGSCTKGVQSFEKGNLSRTDSTCGVLTLTIF